MPFDVLKPTMHVESPGARLAIFAVAHNVDAGVSLQAHCLDHRLGEARLECRFLIRLARLRFLQIRNHRGRAHHTAHMAHDEAAISSQHSLLPWSCVTVASHRPRSSEAAFRVMPGPKGGVRIESACSFHDSQKQDEMALTLR